MIIPFLKRFRSDRPVIADSSIHSLLHPLSANDVALCEHPDMKALREDVTPEIILRDNGVAIIPISGVLVRCPDVFELLFGGVEDTACVYNMIQEAFNNPKVKALVMDIDSPGGFYTGGPDVADLICNMRKSTGKPVVAWTGGQMCSLAYWIGSQANEVISSKSASVGSIGSYVAFYDVSKMLADLGVKIEVITNKEGTLKAMGVPGTSLTDEQRTALQQSNQDVYEEFKAAVEAARGKIGVDDMKGQSFNGTRAKQLGLVDRIGDLEYAIAIATRL